jgi:outer membrane protein OmpA-like peptidoglycan-associated protein
MLSSMPTFNTYQQPAVETPLARKWFIRALIASLLIHAALFATFRATKLEHFNPPVERLVPRTFALGRAQVDEKLLSDEPEKKQEDQQSTPQPVPAIDIPQDKPTADANPQDAVYKPTAPDLVKPIATENPKVTDSDLKNLTKMQQSVSKDLDNDLNKVSEQLIKDKTLSTSKSLLKLSETTKTGGSASTAAGGESAIPGMKSLDDALSSTGGGLKNGDKIGIRGGALFQYDSADLLPDGMNDLKKLALRVKQYPNATLIIEGYADSIGSVTDPQYNKDLSQRRAESVKNFLQTMGIEDFRIQAVGEGSTKFIDPPTYDPAKQAMEPNNRRVEIVFTFPH